MEKEFVMRKPLNRRLWIFFLTFIGLSLVLIPLLSLYGLSVCPILPIPGFTFGCIYTGVYIFFVNLLSLIVVYIFRFNNPKNSLFIWINKHKLITYSLSYFIAAFISLSLLMILLTAKDLSIHSRGPEVLILASILLGITQAYGLNWAMNGLPQEEENKTLPTFHKLWLSHIFRIALPLVIIALILLHFLIRQSVEINKGHTAPVVDHDSLILQASYLITFLLSWLTLTFSFHFLSEKDHAESIQTHLVHLQNLDFKYRSNLNDSWGLWSAFIQQINSFSKILGERTRLLKSFSKFVTAGVAEEALHHELKTNGIIRELTVIMSDIRNFTTISEKLTPTQVVTFLNEYFTAMLDVLSGYHVSVDKFIGDGILAYVEPESEVSSDAAAENNLGVEAALNMIKRLELLNKKLLSMDLPEIKIGIGIYRGPLIIGLIGTEAKLQHTIIGDTVNRTARLEGLCKDLGVLIVLSGQVWQTLHLKQKDLFRSYGKQSVKGLSESMEVFGGPS